MQSNPSNYIKHTHKNTVQKFLIGRFYKTLIDIVKDLGMKNVLDVGCGEGFTLDKFLKAGIGEELKGIDNSKEATEIGKKTFPKINLSLGDIYKIKYKDNTFDLVVCTEVLEHLENPKKALKEILRVTKKYAIFSVPHEPIYTISRFLSGKNIKGFGSNPEHVNFWSAHSFKDFLESHNLKVKKIKLSFPWTIALVEK